MFNNKYNNSFHITIRGTYGSNINYPNNYLENIFYLPPIFNENDLEKHYIQERKNMEKYFYDMKNVTKKLLKNIRFLNKICCFKNITHSNSVNFIMKNYSPLKQLLNNYIIIYNDNLNKIIITKKKIDNIDSNILYIRNNY
jgi:hypothetical protein